MAIDSNTIAYPTSFVIQKRIVSGTISRYNIGTELKSSDTSLIIKAGSLDNSRFFGIELNLDNVSYTSRINTSNVFTQSFDWRLIQNPTFLSELIKYYKEWQDGDELDPVYILDNNLEPILDNNNQPLIGRV